MNEMSVEQLRKIIRLDAKTGKLYWLPRKRKNMFNSRFAGKEALASLNDTGYKRGIVYGMPLFAHRVVWAIYHGEWPKNEIDHKNHNRADNRIANLRDVTTRENFKNQSLYKTNKTGTHGVYFNKARNKWTASIAAGKERKYLGSFDSLDAAVSARKEAEKSLGYHENHGKIPVSA